MSKRLHTPDIVAFVPATAGRLHPAVTATNEGHFIVYIFGLLNVDPHSLCEVQVLQRLSEFGLERCNLVRF